MVEDLDAQAGKDAEVAKLLRNGVADLNRAAGGDFAKLHSDAQVAELKKSKIPHSFRRFAAAKWCRSTTITMVWKKLGYQGASYPIGGYLLTALTI